jgi:type IV pilus assembly protein PilQ
LRCTITPDNSIAIAIETKKEEPDWSRVSAEGTPASKKREANTNVIIRDGETVVIGGVFKTSRQDTDSGVPGLMDLPLVGWLFKNRKTDEATSEMLIFITPRIVQRP